MGFNGTPSGYHTNNCKDIEGKTLPEVVHAEVNAIAKAAKSTISTEDSIMYVTTAPCVECAKLIIQAGIRIVFYWEGWKDEVGSELLRACGVQLIKLEV